MLRRALFVTVKSDTDCLLAALALEATGLPPMVVPFPILATFAPPGWTAAFPSEFEGRFCGTIDGVAAIVPFGYQHRGIRMSVLEATLSKKQRMHMTLRYLKVRIRT